GAPGADHRGGQLRGDTRGSGIDRGALRWVLAVNVVIGVPAAVDHREAERDTDVLGDEGANQGGHAVLLRQLRRAGSGSDLFRPWITNQKHAVSPGALDIAHQ